MTPILPDDDWQTHLLRDEQGHIMMWEVNADLILRNDPVIREQVSRATAKEVERVAMEAMLYLQLRYKLRISYPIMTVMVKLIAEEAKRAALYGDAYSR